MIINVKDAPYNAQGNGVTIDSSSISSALSAAAGAPYGAIVYFPPGVYLIDRPIEMLAGVYMRGEYYSTVLKANSSFNNNRGRYMIRNWKDSDFPSNPVSYLSAPLTTSSPNYVPYIENFYLDLNDVLGVSGIGWVHMQEAGLIQNIVIRKPNNSLGIYLTRNNDTEGSINGGYINKITFYSPGLYPSGFISHIKIAHEDGVSSVGSDIHIANLTTAPVKCKESVFHFQGLIDLTLDNIHCEAYVDPDVSGTNLDHVFDRASQIINGKIKFRNDFV